MVLTIGYLILTPFVISKSWLSFQNIKLVIVTSSKALKISKNKLLLTFFVIFFLLKWKSRVVFWIKYNWRNKSRKNIFKKIYKIRQKIRWKKVYDFFFFVQLNAFIYTAFYIFSIPFCHSALDRCIFVKFYGIIDEI